MLLTKQEEDMASGKYGPGMEKSIKILIKFGDIFKADKLVKISSAHIMPKEPIELLLEFTEGVEKTQVFTTTHPLMSAFDANKWQKQGIDEAYGVREEALYKQRSAIYKRLGIYETYTCLPMMAGNLPLKGQLISWIGTGNQVLVNSLLGARTNRDGTVVNLCAAITGRAPNLGLFLDENRYGQFLVNIAPEINPRELSPIDVAAIGYYVGSRAGNYPVVIDGLPSDFSFDDIKGLVSLSTSGSTCMCHIVGITPEAPDLKTALGGKKPKETMTIGRAEIQEAKAMYQKPGTFKIDMVIIGCPHCSIDDAKKIASLLEGKKVGMNQRLWLGMGAQTYTLAKIMGYTEVIERAGGVVVNSCMATIPDCPLPKEVKVVASNSFKTAHYVTGLKKGEVQVVLGSLDDCINAAISGKMEVKN